MSSRLAVLGLILIVVASVPAFFAMKDLLPPISNGQQQRPSSQVRTQPPDQAAKQTQTTPRSPGTLPQVDAVRKPSGPARLEVPIHYRPESQSFGVLRLESEVDGEIRELKPTENLALSIAPDSVLKCDGVSLLHGEEVELGDEFIDVLYFNRTRSNPELIRPLVLVVCHGEETRFRLRGTSLLPEGDTLFATLKSQDDPVAGGASLIEQGEFEILISIPTRLHSGTFRLFLSWTRSPVDPNSTEALAQALDVEIPPEITIRRSIYLGAKELEVAQDEEIKTYYREVVLEAQTARDAVLALSAYLRGQEEGKYEKKFLEDELRRKAFAKSFFNKRLRQLVDSKGRIRKKHWQHFIDQELPERWRELRDRVPYPKRYPGLSKNLGLLFEELHTLFRHESEMLRGNAQAAGDPEFGPQLSREISIKYINRVLVRIQKEIPLTSQ